MTQLDPGPTPNPPIVDPSPSAPPIQVHEESLDEQLARYPSQPSPQSVLDLEPNRYEDATEGPTEQIDPNTYVTMTKPDGTSFITPLANVQYYRYKGFQEGNHEVILDLVRYWAQKAGQFVTEERTQSTEDAVARLTGVPKTPEELEAEQEALEGEREAKLRAAAGEPRNDPGTVGATTPPNPPPDPDPNPTPEPTPEPTPPPTTP